MATDHTSNPSNGINGQQTIETSGNHVNNHSSNTSQASGNTEIPKEEVAWYFVEQYYRTLSLTPDKLWLFFNKRSQYVSGVEAEKVSVAAGQKAINERIKAFNFEDTKVRVTNVDSQSSDATIVIQVIGEMTTKSQEPKKFVQTFVLASQTNGYFVLNDILRYIRDEDVEETEERPVELEPEQEESLLKKPIAAASTIEVNQPDQASSPATIADNKGVEVVDKVLEKVAKEQAAEQSSETDLNGLHVAQENNNLASVSMTEEPPSSTLEILEQEPIIEQQEAPKDPAPSPTAAAAQTKEQPAASAPPKPAVPKSWAQLAAGSRAAAAAAAATSTPSAAPSQIASPPAKATPALSNKASQPPAENMSTAPANSDNAMLPVREPSPDSQKDGSQGGWQMAGDGHSRKQVRPPVQPPIQQDSGRVRAYVKNVFQNVGADQLKTHLSQFGELAYFDISRAKNSAFVEFTTRAAFDAAVAANPHKIGNDNVFVEERRLQAAPFRGGGGPRGGRGSFEGRPQSGRGGFKNDGSGRGGPSSRAGRGGAPRGRGVASATT